MLTLSLDEFGDFEGLNEEKTPIYIAGILYEEKIDEPDTDTERKRVEEYYKHVINDACRNNSSNQIVYPDALHSNGNTYRDRHVVKPVKQQVNKTMQEFLQKGTYKGQELQSEARKGKYHIFVFLKSGRGLQELLKTNANIFSKDDYASNLYFHMANQLISRLIFHNPLIKNINNIWLDIATRSSGNLDEEDPIYEEYKKLQYRENHGKYGSHFTLTNDDVYRSLISKGMIDSNKTDIKVSYFDAASIKYKQGVNYMEFLYLADSICSILGFRLKGNNENEWLEKIDTKVKNLTGREDNLIFGYDEVDVLYSQAYEDYEKGDYYQAFNKLFELKQQTGKFVEYYKQNWVTKLEKDMIEKGTISIIDIALLKLEDSLYSNGFNQDRCLYIYKELEKLATNIFKEKPRNVESQKMLYRLYDAGISCYCHIGDSDHAYECFEECKKYVGVVGLENYLYTRNKVVVFNTDEFDFIEALELGKEDLMYHEQLFNLKKKIKLPASSNLSYGQAYSQLGQTYAFLREEKAEELFKKALACFPDNSNDYKQTQSYLLHYYLDNRNNKYYEEAKHYFGGNDTILDQFEYIANEGSKENAILDFRFALYVLIRGIYIFRMNEVTDDIWESIKEKINEYSQTLQGHPCEIIYKYLSLIALQKDKEEAEVYFSQVNTCLENKAKTIEALIQYGEIEYYQRKKDTKKVNQLSKQLYKSMMKNFNKLKPKGETEEYLDWLSNLFTFMYH